MRLIGLAVVLAAGLTLAPLVADAQQAKVYRVGVLSTGNPRSTAIYQALEQRLHELGYIEARTSPSNSGTPREAPTGSPPLLPSWSA